MSRSINPVPQYFDNSGNIIGNGLMFFFKSGTNAALDTFADSELTIKNTHPVVLDGAGRLPPVFFDGSSKQVLKDSDGVQIFERDPVGADNVTGSFSLYSSVTLYDVNDIVEGSDGKFYISLVNSNQGSDPVTPSPTKWSEIRFIGVYNASETYAIGDVVQEATGLMFRSIINDNLANTPGTDDGTKWLPVANNPWNNKSSAFAVLANKRYQIDASGGAVDASLATAYVVGDQITVHNESISTNLVRLTNTALTIKAPLGTITSSDNLVLEAGDTVQMVAKTTLILEVV